MKAHVKAGFHAGLGGNRTGIGDYFRQLDQAGIPFVIKSVNDVGLAVEAASYARASGVDHRIVLRFTNPGGGKEIPDYKRSPDDAALVRFNQLKLSLASAPEFGPYKDLIWLEVDNEPRTKEDPDDPMFNDMDPADWLGWYAYYMGLHTSAVGIKYAALGIAAGEPEPGAWHYPGMRRFLQLCDGDPEHVAIALHEYTLNLDPMRQTAPHLMGRFRWLHDACNEMEIGRPPILITEAGWVYNDIPDRDLALVDVAWYSELLSRHPNVLGAHLWRLDGQSVTANKLQKLIVPITEFALAATYEVPDEEPPPTPGATIVRLASMANLRLSPHYDSVRGTWNKIAILPAGAELELEEMVSGQAWRGSDQWAKVKLGIEYANGNVDVPGYVHSWLVEGILL